MKQKHYSVFFLGLLFISAVQAQMMVKNSADGEVMRITQDKKVAIGTTAPAGKMTIAAVQADNFVLFCTGNKSYFDSPVLIGKTTLSDSEKEAELLIYQNKVGSDSAANLILKGMGDGTRYSQIQLGRTDNERKWLINYHQETNWAEDLTLTYHDGNIYRRFLRITDVGHLHINTDNYGSYTTTSPLCITYLPVANSNDDAKNNKGLSAGAFYRDSSGFVRVVY